MSYISYQFAVLESWKPEYVIYSHSVYYKADSSQLSPCSQIHICILIFKSQPYHWTVDCYESYIYGEREMHCYPGKSKLNLEVHQILSSRMNLKSNFPEQVSSLLPSFLSSFHLSLFLIRVHNTHPSDFIMKFKKANKTAL